MFCYDGWLRGVGAKVRNEILTADTRQFPESSDNRLILRESCRRLRDEVHEGERETPRSYGADERELSTISSA